MNTLVATLHRGEHFVPVAFDVRAVGVNLMIQPSLFQYVLTLNNVLAHRDTNAHRDDAQIYDDFHFDKFRWFWSGTVCFAHSLDFPDGNYTG